MVTAARYLGVTVEQALEAYGVYFVRHVADEVRHGGHSGMRTHACFGERKSDPLGTTVNNNNNNKRPLTPKSMPPAGDEHAKLKT